MHLVFQGTWLMKDCMKICFINSSQLRNVNALNSVVVNNYEYISRFQINPHAKVRPSKNCTRAFYDNSPGLVSSLQFQSNFTCSYMMLRVFETRIPGPKR